MRITDLAQTLAARHDITETAATEAIYTTAEQLSDLGEHVWVNNSELTPTAAELIAEAIAAYQAPATVVEQSLAGAVEEVAHARVHLDGALDDRDRAIREALAGGMTYADVGAVTGLSRGQLDAIRRGLRRRG